MKYLWFIGLISCGSYVSKDGIEVAQIPNSSFDLGRIQLPQLDAAWVAAMGVWSVQRPAEGLYVLLWDRPITFDNGKTLDAGAQTADMRINVYLKDGDESCLFRVGNEGALVHEISHVLIGDPEHKDERWEQVGPTRELLRQTYCDKL